MSRRCPEAGRHNLSRSLVRGLLLQFGRVNRAALLMVVALVFSGCAVFRTPKVTVSVDDIAMAFRPSSDSRASSTYTRPVKMVMTSIIMNPGLSSLNMSLSHLHWRWGPTPNAN